MVANLVEFMIGPICVGTRSCKQKQPSAAVVAHISLDVLT